LIPTLVWTLPRPPLSKYRGGFPRFFEENLVKLLGHPDKILQPFGGRAEYGHRVDLDPLTEPTFVGDAHNLRKLTVGVGPGAVGDHVEIADNTYDLVLLDPPYSQQEALELYGVTKTLRPGLYKREAVRVCKPGGYVVIYTDKEPRRPAYTNHAMRIVVILRPGHSPRIAGVFQKRKPGMPFYDTEPGETSSDS
jgi:hypothetical protein